MDGRRGRQAYSERELARENAPLPCHTRTHAHVTEWCALYIYIYGYLFVDVYMYIYVYKCVYLYMYI